MRSGGDPHEENKSGRPKVRAPDIDGSMRYWLQHYILGMSYGEIARREGQYDGYGRVEQAERRVRQNLPDRWGQLLPSRATSRKSTVNMLFRDFIIDEVVRIAQGTHPLSDATEDALVVSYLPDRVLQRSIYDLGKMVDTPLAKRLADHVFGKYPSRSAATRALGIGSMSLKYLLYARPRRLVRRNFGPFQSPRCLC